MSARDRILTRSAARTAVRELPSADWANYLHYGSFDFALKSSP